MSETMQPHSPLPPAKFPPLNITRLIIVAAVLAAVGFAMIGRYHDAEIQREMRHWQVKLNLIADSRVADVNGWVESQFGELQSLAENASLQLYVTQLQGGADMAPEQAEASYLRNLLVFTAARGGFGSQQKEEIDQIPANVRKLSDGGIALLDASYKPLVSTLGMPIIEGDLLETLKAQKPGQPSLLDVRRTKTGELQIGFTVPVFTIQGDADANAQVAQLVGIKTLSPELFGLLKHPGVTEKTLQAALVRADGNNVVNLSPLEGGAKPLEKPFLLTTPDLDASYALSNPGEFGERSDYAGNKVLMVSRAVVGTPWSLMVKIDRREALADGAAFRARMTIMLMLALALMIAVTGAAWWYGTSRRAMLLTEQSNRLTDQYAQQEKLLRLVTDNQPEPIFIVDHFNKLRFVNDKAAKALGASAQELSGKELSNAMGPARAEEYMEASRSALEMDKPISRVQKQYEQGAARIIRSEHIPLKHIPIDTLPYPTAGVLVVDQDITEAVSERERRAAILRQIVNTLVRMVDQRDPYSSNHSALVTHIAREIADEMSLDAKIIETTDIAGSLMNIGKMVVPSEVLTKTSSLNDNEIQTIRKSLQQSADVLDGIDFDGPVVETLRQAPEHWDGSGPQKLKGDDILVSARIIAVANAFVGMASPRSYRAALSVDEVLKQLLKQIDLQFDRRVVIALINYMDNKGGRAELEKLSLKAA